MKDNIQIPDHESDSENNLIGLNNDSMESERRLDWKDLLIVVVGIAVIYFGAGYLFILLGNWYTNERVLLYLNAFGTQVLFLILIFIVMKIRRWSWQDFGWKSVQEGYMGKVVTLYILAWIINIAYVAFIVSRGFTPPETDAYTKLLSNNTLITLIVNLILAGILAPIIEETLFRGVIFGSLQTYMGKWTAAAVSAAFFSGLHLQAYGFFPRFVLGILLAYLYIRYKSIKPAIALHATNNIMALLLVVLVEGI